MKARVLDYEKTSAIYDMLEDRKPVRHHDLSITQTIEENPGPDKAQNSKEGVPDSGNKPVVSQSPASKSAARLRHNFTKLMRFMPQGLVVVFASKKENPRGSFRWYGERGMLVSSFSSLTVDPEPCVSFNIKLPSSTFDELNETGIFTVVAVNNAKVADAFTTQSEDRDTIFRNLMFKTPEKPFTMQGVVWWMRCELMRHHCVQVGDHKIVVGRVVLQGRYNDVNRREALVYCNGRYRHLGKVVTPESDAPRISNLLPREVSDHDDSAEAERVSRSEMIITDLEGSEQVPRTLQETTEDLRLDMEENQKTLKRR